MKNVSMRSSCETTSASTFKTVAYPPDSSLQCFSIAIRMSEIEQWPLVKIQLFTPIYAHWNICQPQSLYFFSPVRRYAMNKDSTVSGLQNCKTLDFTMPFCKQTQMVEFTLTCIERHMTSFPFPLYTKPSQNPWCRERNGRNNWLHPFYIPILWREVGYPFRIIISSEMGNLWR